MAALIAIIRMAWQITFMVIVLFIGAGSGVTIAAILLMIGHADPTQAWAGRFIVVGWIAGMVIALITHIAYHSQRKSEVD